ncbi:branched-chain amino acid ABC transporter permease/ATP-binding protein [Nocardia sp. alder85J]|uniref:branched-chain amino acid ABC transporter permease/ATP-binding protein n=1 Tax=Nocardia sp. alder85J TaxID=2862949 RepID=UPI001CD359ED|nr:branched-chain amino acid ABC transporter permease/ATP-binding protein [Nocardia sp. alder85J]MCX4095603.1 branched-chain amino acid ABC transporter permease/ATP-binding protein [Nocardia sp. alder85J]
MDSFVKFLLIGLGAGGVYVLLSLGIVLIYRGSGVVNFSQGALALLGAAVYYELRTDMPPAAAILVAIASCAAAGVLIQLGVMRPMRHASPVARVVATLAVLTLISSVATRRYGSLPKRVPSFLPTKTVEVFPGIFAGKDRLIILAIAVGLAVVLWIVYRVTRFGLATTGVAENEVATAAMGWSPGMIAAGNWAAGGALAGLAGALLVPITGLSPGALVLAVVPALAASLVGEFRSFLGTLVGGLLMGVLESETTHYVKAPGWASAMPFIVIILLLMFRGGALPLRGHLAERLPKLGEGKPPWIFTTILAVLLWLSFFAFGTNWTAAIVTTLVYGLLVLSLVVVTGFAGQLSLAQFALAGIGALIATRMNAAWGVPFWLTLLAGVVFTVPIGLIVALPAVRARGANLAVVTLGLATVITSVVLGNPDYTGGPVTGTVVRPPTLFGIQFDYLGHTDRYALMVLVLLLIACWCVANVRRSRSGRRMIAVRSNERAAASLGISVVSAKLYAFGLGAAIAALGGILLAYVNTNINFAQFDVLTSINLVLYAVLGGVGFVSGSAFGAQLAPGTFGEFLIDKIPNIQGWFPVAAAVLLLVTIVLNADGVAAHTTRQKAAVVDRLRSLGRRPDRAARAVVHAPATSADRPARPVAEPKTLEIRGLAVAFGGVKALDGVDLEVAPGEIVGLIGPNGAGKTTLVDAASGFLRGYQGRITLGGKVLDGNGAVLRSRRGLTRSFQSLELFEDLTVADNLRAASDERDIGAYFTNLVKRGTRKLSDQAAVAIEQFELWDCVDKFPHELSYAQRRLVGIARSVATSPSVLLLDEPAAGLDDVSTRELAELIRRLAAERSIGVLLIEHDISMVMGLCDRIVALNFGRVIGSGTPEEIRGDAAVVAAYLGEQDVAEEAPAGSAVVGAGGSAGLETAR